MKWTFIIILVIVVIGFMSLDPEQQESFKEKAKDLWENRLDSALRDERVWMGRPIFDCESDEDCKTIEDCFNCSCADNGECFQIS